MITGYRRVLQGSAVLLAWPLLAVVTTARADTNAMTKGVQPREAVLNNGLKLLLVERHEQPIVAAGVFYKVGGVDDPRGKSGIAHLFEHMLFKGSRVIGTSNYDSEKTLIEQEDRLWAKMNDEMNRMREMKRRGQISDVLDPKQWTAAYTEMKKQYDELVAAGREYVKNNELFNLYTTNGGAGLNAGTMEDATMYYVQLPSNKLELFLWLESDRMQNGIMREFYVERDNVREERRLRVESTPTGKYEEAFQAMFWQSHPYGVPVIGWPSEVESITRDDVRDFYRVYYAPNNATVVMVGDFDADKTIEAAKRYFERVPRGAKEPPPVITEEPRPTSQKRLNAEAETNPRVRIRFHTVAMRHTDEAALDVAGELLSGKTGRLYKRLVTKEDVGIGEPRAGNQSRKYAGSFDVSVTVKEGHDPEAVEKIVLEEIDKLREGEITDRELQKVKNQVLASMVQRLRTNAGLMFQLGLFETFGDWKYINTSPELQLAVTVDDVHRVVKEYLDPATRTVAIYRTKAADGAQASDDPELAAVLAGMSPEEQGQVKMLIERVRTMDDAGKLAPRVEAMQTTLDSGQVPEDKQKVLAYMLKTMKARLAELEASKKESN